jgi:hypothetical protein
MGRERQERIMSATPGVSANTYDVIVLGTAPGSSRGNRSGPRTSSVTEAPSEVWLCLMKAYRD